LLLSPSKKLRDWGMPKPRISGLKI